MAETRDIVIICSRCSKAEQKPVRWVQENTFFTCPSCGATVLIDKDAAMRRLAESQGVA